MKTNIRCRDKLVEHVEGGTFSQSIFTFINGILSYDLEKKMSEASCLILFGAGASQGSGECIPEKIPLGSELINKMIDRNPGLWGHKRQDQIDVKSTGKTSFEQMMDEHIEKGFDVVPYQKDLAAYFSLFEAPLVHLIHIMPF